MDKYRQRSMVWSYFKDTDADSVQCLLCSEFVHRKDSASTTPMLRHLRLKHPAELPGTELDLNAESAANQEHQSMEIDGEQIISVVVEMEDEVSNTKTLPNDSDVSGPVSALPETSQEYSAEQMPVEPSDDYSVRSSRRRSLIWRLFEHLESLNAARCRICLKKLHESGGVSNLRRHLRKRHPMVLSELLASENQLPTAPSLDAVIHENQQDPVVLVEGDTVVMAVLPAPENPVNGLVEDSAQITPAEEGSGVNAGTGETSWNKTQKWIPVEALQDGNLDIATPSNETEINSAINGILETLQKGSKQAAPAGEGEDQSVKKPRRRSLMWQHFKRLESLNMAQCQICMKKLQCFESGCTSNLHRHMSKRHPQVFSKQQQQHPTPNSNSLKTITLRRHDERMPVEALEDDDADIATPSNETEINSDLNSILRTVQKGSTQAAPAGEGEDQSVKKPRRRSLIWQHFKRLESLKAVQCQICMKKLQWFEGGCTSNLHRHMSKRHPQVFSKQQQQQQQQHLTPNSNSLKTITLRRHDERMPVPAGGPAGSREAEVESRAIKQEKELIEALRRTQREEARTLDQQRELVERLRAASARETAAERENIELLRKLQQQEAKELSRQREELEKEKTELQRRWEELQQEKEEILLLSRDKEPSG